MITVLMVLDAVVGLLLIASVIMQTPKAAGMGMGGGSDTVFSSSARGLDALLARVTVVLAAIFAVLTLFIAKTTAF